MVISAAIDIGTNSVRLLVAEYNQKQGSIEKILQSRVITTRIGEGMTTSSTVLPGAIERTIRALEVYKAILDTYSLSSLRVVATSALREAKNGDYFRELALARTNLKVEIISGEEEAYLSFVGAMGGNKNSALEKNLVIDVGGGSTELIWQKGTKIICESLPVGAVRMTEANSSEEAIEKIFEPLISKINFENIDITAVGGTITSLAAMDLKLVEYDPELVHGHKLAYTKVIEIHDLIEHKTIDERKGIPGLQPQRADIILAGIKIYKVLMKLLKVDKLSVSESDILQGIIFSTGKKY